MPVMRHLAERAAVSRIAPKVRRAAAPRYRSFRKHRTRPTSMNPSARWAAALTSLSGCASDANSLQPCDRPHSSAATISARPTPLRRAFGTTNHPSRYATRLLPQPSAYARIDSSASPTGRSEEHTSELQSRLHLVCRLLLEKKKNQLTTAQLDAGL